MTPIEKAFEQFCRDPDVGAGIEISGVALAVVRLAYMAGAKYATDRCETEHHFPKGTA